ncbi:phage tail-collar fiber domain-containing protein [Spartinivicinus marinus]|uniref:phage tail-collar fiber domain-containing protein n=1 Tax=Spartinivicinus marinus TaxID=2994442 RepID=UPI0022578B3F|nr:phage tail protein [Spartinivicinus marinus]MCX4025163.1 phage tail protein [Spartinivicinus marinus]
MQINPIITDAGLQAVFNASNDGLQATIAEIALGDGRYQPNAKQTQLKSEQLRLPISKSERAGKTHIILSAIADGESEFWIREFGIFLEDGTLLAVWSSLEKALQYKAASAPCFFSTDFILSGMPADAITVNDQGADIAIALFLEQFAMLSQAQIDQMRRHLELLFSFNQYEKTARK